jgi:hypothetical protein
MGIEPLEAGFSKIQIKPQPGSLTQASFDMPSIRGPVHVDFTAGTTYDVHVAIPANARARVPFIDIETRTCPADGRVLGNAMLFTRHGYYYAGTGCCTVAPGGSRRSLVTTNSTAIVDGPNHYTVEIVGQNIKLWANGT